MNNNDKIYETNFEFCNDNQSACYSSTDPVWIKRIYKLANKYPEEVRIVEYREKESICVNVPKEWFKVQPKTKRGGRVMTEEQKAAAAERMRIAREKKKAERETEKQNSEVWL